MLSTLPEQRFASFDVHGAGVLVTSDDDQALGAISSFLGPFASADTPTYAMSFELATVLPASPRCAETTPVCDLGFFRMTKTGTQRFIDAGGIGAGEADLASGSARIWTNGWGDGYAWGMSRLIFLPLWAMLLKTTGRFTVHAAGVAREGRALLFPTASGGGKSVLTMNLVSAGYELLGDDTQFLVADEGHVRVAGFTETIALREGAREFFPWLADLPKSEGGRTCVDPWERGLPIAEEPAMPGILAFPHLTGEQTSTFEPITRSEALRRLIPCTFFFTDEAMLEEHLGALSQLVAGSRCYRLGVGTDASSLVDCVERMENES